MRAFKRQWLVNLILRGNVARLRDEALAALGGTLSGKTSLELQSPRARSRHATARKEGKTCIECHFGIPYKEPDDPGPAELFGEPGS